MFPLIPRSPTNPATKIPAIRKYRLALDRYLSGLLLTDEAAPSGEAGAPSIRRENVDRAPFLAIVRPFGGLGPPLDFQRKRTPMFAVIRTGGKQYKVAKDDVITVERLAAEPGASVTLGEVIMIGDGADANLAPAGAAVTAEVVRQIKGEKVLIFKKRRRHN